MSPKVIVKLFLLCSMFNVMVPSSGPSSSAAGAQPKKLVYCRDIQKILDETPVRMTAESFGNLNNGQFPDIRGFLVPSLEQTGLYCGYYALYNALCFLHPKVYNPLDVEQFKVIFAQQLAAIRKSRCQSNCENLYASELRELVGNEHIAIIQISSMFDYSNQTLPTLAEILNDKRSADLINGFLGADVKKEQQDNASSVASKPAPTEQEDDLVIICGIGDPRRKTVGHWIAMKAVRRNKIVLLTVADSIRRVADASEMNSDYIARNIEPIYYMVTHRPDEWKNFCTAERAQKFFPDIEHPVLTPTVKSFKGCSYKSLLQSSVFNQRDLITCPALVRASDLGILGELTQVLSKIFRTIDALTGLLRGSRISFRAVRQLINNDDCCVIYQSIHEIFAILDDQRWSFLNPSLVTSVRQVITGFTPLLAGVRMLDFDGEPFDILKDIDVVRVSCADCLNQVNQVHELASVCLCYPNDRLQAHSEAHNKPSEAAQQQAPMQPINLGTQPAQEKPIVTIFDAIHAKNKARFLELATQQTINTPDANGHMPLHVAVMSKNTDAANWLIHIKDLKPNVRISIDLNAVDREGYTALHYAVATGDRALVAELLNNEADANVYKVNQRSVWVKSGCRSDKRLQEMQNDDDCRTPLHIAARYGYAPIVEELLSDRKNKAFVDAQDYFGATPLIDAINAGHQKVIDVLLAHNAQCNLFVNRDRYWTRRACDLWVHCVNASCFIGAPSASLMASIHGDDLGLPFRASCNMFVGQPLNRGQNALHAAVARNDLEVVPKLIKAGAYIDARDVGGRTPLIIAAQYGFEKIVQYLIEHKATIDAVALPLQEVMRYKNLKSDGGLFGDTALIGAARHGHCTVVELLINAHADIYYGRCRALRIAIENNKTDVIRLLINHGACIACLDEEHQQSYWIKHLLHETAESGNLDRLKMLLTPKTFVDKVDEENTRPLHYAAHRGHLEAVKELRARMASLREPNNMGLIPLHCAATSAHRNVVRYLLSSDTNGDNTVNAQNIFGLTPLHAAIMAGNVDIACDLIDRGASTSIPSARNLTPLDYANATQATKFYFMPTQAIAEIVQEHLSPSPIEDEQGITLDIAQAFNGLFIGGSVVPSLQQIRDDFTSTGYCGYYALYNALSFLDPENILRLDRKQFTEFFRPALQEIWNFRKHGPYDYLMSNEIRHLVNTFYKNSPIIVLDKNDLYSLVSGTKKLEEALEHDERSINLWRQFIARDNEQAELVLVARTGLNCGHWIALHFKRHGEVATIDVADSLHSVVQWQFNSLMIASVLPFYLALISPDCAWHDIFNDEIKPELFDEYMPNVSDTVPNNCPARELYVGLSHFMESIDRLARSLKKFVGNRVPSNHVEVRDQLVTCLRVHKFFKVTTQVLHLLVESLSDFDTIHTVSEEKNKQLVERIRTLADTIFNNLAPTIAQIKDLNNQDLIDEESIFKIYEKITVTIDILSLLKEQSLAIIKQVHEIVEVQHSLELFDTEPVTLDTEHLKIVLESAPSIIRSTISFLKNAQRGENIIRILFVGPPGCGKTTLGQAIAQECGRPLKFIRVSSLGDKFQFSREKDLKTLLPFIEQNPNAVIILDELDAIVNQEHEPTRTAQVLQSIIDICNRKYPDVIFIGTTNDQNLIPPALFSRFSQCVVEIPNPDLRSRIKIVERCIAKLTTGPRTIINKLSAKDIKRLAKLTANFSIRSLEAVFSNLIMLVPSDGDGKNQLCMKYVLVAYAVVKKGLDSQHDLVAEKEALENRRYYIEQGKYAFDRMLSIYGVAKEEIDGAIAAVAKKCHFPWCKQNKGVIAKYFTKDNISLFSTVLNAACSLGQWGWGKAVPHMPWLKTTVMPFALKVGAASLAVVTSPYFIVGAAVVGVAVGLGVGGYYGKRRWDVYQEAKRKRLAYESSYRGRAMRFLHLS